MANNKLILRSLKSPWLTPIPDFTKGSVLTHDDLDNNQIYLKGEIIQDAYTSNGFTTLRKVNGTKLTYDNDQNNLIESRSYIASFTYPTVQDLINNDPRGLIIDDKTNYFITVKKDGADLLYAFTSGKGVWGMNYSGSPGTTVVESDFILINTPSSGETTFSPWEVGDGLQSIKATNDSGLNAYGDYSVAEGFNTSASGFTSHASGYNTTASGDYSHASGKGFDDAKLIADGRSSFAHFEVSNNLTDKGVYGDNSVILGGLDHNINLGVDRSVVLGGSGTTATQSDTVYVPNLNISQISEEFTGNTSLTIDNQGNVKKYNQNILFRATWAELDAIRASSGLTTGRKVILTDYVHKYQINSSDSGDIGQLHTMIGSSGAYTQFNNVPSDVAKNGDVVEIVEVPPGSSRVPGTLVTIVDYFNIGYIRFSPTIINGSDVGTVFKFSKQRYPNVSGGATILDINGKPVFKKGGVINTEVHDGLPYMDMTGAENPAPIVEEIVLTALDEKTFSTEAESLTFPGDKLEYLFDLTTISDEDGNIISGVTRNGLIIRRENQSLGIDVNKDWRNQRYRRYKVDEENWTKMLLKGDNAELYTYNGKNYSSTVNNSLDDEHKYVMKAPVEVDFYLDFWSASNNDIFLSGETSTPPTQAAARTFDLTPPYLRDVTLPVSGLTNAMDIHILPIEDYKPTDIVKQFNVNILTNSVFRGLNQVYGFSGDFYVNIKGSIADSSINTGVGWDVEGRLGNIIAIDRLEMGGSGDLDGMFNSNYTRLTNSGVMKNIRLGGYRNTMENNFIDLTVDSSSLINNTIIGVSRADALVFSNFICVRGLLQADVFRTCKYTGTLYCTNINSSGVMTSLDIDISNLNKKVLNKPLFGTKHIIPNSLNNIRLDDSNAKSDLITRGTDENYITTITKIGTTQ